MWGVVFTSTFRYALHYDFLRAGFYGSIAG
jgi:hypothetical protein